MNKILNKYVSYLNISFIAYKYIFKLFIHVIQSVQKIVYNTSGSDSELKEKEKKLYKYISPEISHFRVITTFIFKKL